MKKQLTALLLTGLLSATAMADTVLVVGSFTRLDINDFNRSGNNYVATVNIDGDNGQQLIFDADARVSGQGKQDRYIIDTCDVRGGNGVCYEPGIDVIFDQDFRYMVELKLTCSGLAIGSDLKHKNALVNGPVTNKARSVDLQISKEMVTQGYCQQLKVEVKGLDLDTIDSIDLDLLVAESF